MLTLTSGFLCSQTEMQIKVLDSKHQEEKLKMQQKHDADVEKVRMRCRCLCQHHLPLHPGYFTVVIVFICPETARKTVRVPLH